MGITNYTKNKTILLIGGSSVNIPTHFFIGVGSSIDSPTDTTLIDGVDSQTFTTTSYPSLQKVRQQGDWNSVEMSGIQLSEFGIGDQSDSTGSIWSKTGLPSLTFDGTNELRIEETWEVI